MIQQFYFCIFIWRKQNTKLKIHTHINEVSFVLKKEWNLAIFNNMNGTWGHYTKWIKSEKRQIPYDLICGKRKQKPKPRDTENRLVLERGGVSGRPKVSETVKICKFPLISKSWDIIYSLVTIINNTVSYIWRFLRVNGLPGWCQ